MAMSAGGSSGGVTSDINVTPMIDVLLVLLIIFMIIQPLNRQTVPVDQLDTQIHAIYDARPVKLLFVKPGLNRIYQDVIEAMDVARGAGVQVIGFTPADVVKGS